MAQILIVDADDLAGDLAADMLIQAGHGCGWVDNATKAMALLKWRRPDLILLDSDSSGTDTGDLLDRLRASHEFADLPVIMLTTLSADEFAETDIVSGAQGMIRKPFDQKIVRRTVEEALAGATRRTGQANLRRWLAQNSGRHFGKPGGGAVRAEGLRAVC